MILLFVIRLMGKSELSKMSPFQLVVLFLIAELAAIPIAEPTIPVINGVVAIFALLVLQVLISFLSIKSEKFKNFVNGKPSTLIEKGAINQKELVNLRISLNDLLEQLRLGNAPSISDVDYAVMEANGDLSIILKPDKRPLTPSDINMKRPEASMPLVLISDGVLYTHNLTTLAISEEELQDHLSSAGIKDHKSVFLAFCDEKKKIHLYITDPNTKMSSEVV